VTLPRTAGAASGIAELIRRDGLAIAITMSALAVSFATKWTCIEPERAEAVVGRFPESACYNDVAPLFFSRFMDVGAFPYAGAPPVSGGGGYLEYPALTGLWTWVVAGLARGAASVMGSDASSLHVYFWINSALLAVLWVVAVLLTARLSRWESWKVALVAAPLLAVHGFTNWDAIPVALTAAAMYAWARERPVAAGILIGLGTAAKLYPVLLLGPLLVLCLRAGTMRSWVRSAGAAAAALLVVNLPIAILFTEGWSEFFRLNSTRPPEWNSWYFIVGTIIGRGLPLVNVLSIVLLLAACAGIAYLALAAARRPRFAQLAFLVVAAFLLTNKVWSPQYSLWILPLVILALPRWRLIVAWQLSEALVWLVLTPHLGILDHPGTGLGPLMAVEIVRHVIVTSLVVLVVRDVLRPERDPVRADGIDDPGGGVLDRAPDRLVLRRGRIARAG
jgi:uncharacterized membrane protein